MKPNSNRRAIIVGMFVLLGLAIFVITILTLGSQKKTFASSITIKSLFNDVNGLQKGNNIWYSGVKVGTIKKVLLTGNGNVEVDMSIEQHSRQFIRKDAKAKISSDGLIGNKIIVIYGGTLQSPEVETGDILGVQKLLSTDEMMSTLAKNNDNLLEITDGFKIISKRIVDGQGSVGKLLTDESLSNDLSATMVTLKKAAANMANLSANLSAYTAKLQSKGSLANNLVTDTIVFSNLKSTVTQLQEVTETSKSVMNNLKTASASLNTGLNNLNEGLNNNKAPLGMLLNDEEAALSLKITLKNLQTGTKKLDEDLEALQHNFLLRGFFRKKARREKADSIEN